MESKYGYTYLHPSLLWKSVEDDCSSTHTFILGWGSSRSHASAGCSVTNRLVMSSWNGGSDEMMGHQINQCLFFSVGRPYLPLDHGVVLRDAEQVDEPWLEWGGWLVMSTSFHCAWDLLFDSCPTCCQARVFFPASAGKRWRWTPQGFTFLAFMCHGLLQSGHGLLYFWSWFPFDTLSSKVFLFMRTCLFPIWMFPGLEKSRTMLCFLRNGVPKMVS